MDRMSVIRKFLAVIFAPVVVVASTPVEIFKKWSEILKKRGN
jgi:hypothetical protein